MGRIITSPIKGWGGTIVLYDPITLPMDIALSDAREAVRNFLLNKLEKDGYKPSLEEKEFRKSIEKGFTYSLKKRNQIFWPALRQFIQEWHIEAFPFPNDNEFPSRPSQKSTDFMSWLLDEIAEESEETEEAKNE